MCAKNRCAALFLRLILLFSLSTGLAEGVMEPDYDLTALNNNLRYAQITHIMREPEEYLGRIIRITGKFNYGEKTGRSAIINGDNSGCCEVGLPFICADALSYPDDYPALYATITLSGRLEEYDDEGVMRFRFVDAYLE